MSIPLSERTEFLIAHLFHRDLADRVRTALLGEVSESIPFCEDSNPVGMERIRFSVIRLVDENEANLDIAVRQAQTDWRDLFLMAKFEAPSSHVNWFQTTKERTAAE